MHPSVQTPFGGERGIRTLDTLLTYTPLAGARLQPLGHLSTVAEFTPGDLHFVTSEGLYVRNCAGRHGQTQQRDHRNYLLVENLDHIHDLHSQIVRHLLPAHF